MAGRGGDRGHHRRAAEGKARHVGLLDPVRPPARRVVLPLVRPQPVPPRMRRALSVPPARSGVRGEVGRVIRAALFLPPLGMTWAEISRPAFPPDSPRTMARRHATR